MTENKVKGSDIYTDRAAPLTNRDSIFDSRPGLQIQGRQGYLTYASDFRKPVSDQLTKCPKRILKVFLVELKFSFLTNFELG